MAEEFGYNQQLEKHFRKHFKERDSKRRSKSKKYQSTKYTTISINQSEKNNLPPQVFESNEDSLDGFDLAEFSPR